MKESLGYRQRLAERGERPVIGRGSGCTIRELNRALNAVLEKHGVHDVHDKSDARHFWKRGRAHRGEKNDGQELKAAPKVPKAFRPPRPAVATGTDIWEVL